MSESKRRITADTLVEELLDIPGVITYCIQRGFSPYQCSGGYPCSLGKLLAARNIPDPEGFLSGLNDFVAGRSK